MASRSLSLFVALYLVLFGALGAEVPFLPPFLATAGLSSAQIGLVLAVGTAAQVCFSPLFGLAADRFGTRLVLGIATTLAVTSILLFFVSPRGLWPLLSVNLLFAIATSPLNPLSDALAVPACIQEGVPYGRVRGVGSVGFLVGILASSAVAERLGTDSFLLVAAILLGLMILVIPALPAASPATPDEKVGDIGPLLMSLAFRRVLLVAALVIGGHAMSDAFAVIQWREAGIRANTIGLLLSIAVGSEFLFFAVLGPMLLGRFGPSTCAALGAVAGCMRWAVLAETNNIWLLIASQLCHGLTFSLVYLACMQVLASTAPPRFFATAQSLFGVCCNSLSSAIITLVSGALYGTMHSHAFWITSSLCLFAIPFTIKLEPTSGRSYQLD